MAKKRADGNYKKSFSVDGKRYYIYGKNPKELFEKEIAKRNEIEQRFEQRNNPTFSQYYERWTDARRGTIKENTIRGQLGVYGVISSVYIPSASRTFGELKIKEITIDDLRVVSSDLLKSRKARTVNDYMAHINHCMRDALKERVIDYNPCILLKNLKDTDEAARDTCHRALSLEEQKAFFECDRCKSSYYYNVLRFAICTGMRSGEIGALRYSDIRQGMIHVERTITRTESGSHVIGEDAKTKAGRRVIPVTPQIESILEEQSKLNANMDGRLVTMNELVFRAYERGLLTASIIDRDIRRICKKCKVTPFSMHALRATFATRAIESGMNPKTLQEILGHSNFNITMSLYGHCLENTKQKEMAGVVINL